MTTPLRSVLLLLVTVGAAAACEKNAVLEIAGPQTGGANVKFFNFSVGSPAVNFYINNTKYTGVSSTSCFVLTDANRDACTSTGIQSTSGVAYGSSANSANGWYSDVAPGQITVEGRIAAAVDNGLAIATVQAPVVEGKFYSYFLSGTYNSSTKTTDSFMLEDAMPEVDFSTAYVRFVHASGTANPMTLYVKDRTTGTEVAVGTQVAYKTGTEFVAVPVASYDLAGRYGGSSTNAVTRTAVSFFAGRVYTITLRGTTSMAFDNTANR